MSESVVNGDVLSVALLKHALNGNDTEALKIAEKNLEEYLINK